MNRLNRPWGFFGHGLTSGHFLVTMVIVMAINELSLGQKLFDYALLIRGHQMGQLEGQ